MSADEKLDMIDRIWADLLEREDRVSSPASHAEVLVGRERMAASGEAQFHDLDETKRRIADRIK